MKTLERTLHDGRWQLFTEMPNGYEVSTVRLADEGVGGALDVFLDPLFDRDSEKRYETMVFPVGSRLECAVRRYATREEAREGHRETVEEWERVEKGSRKPLTVHDLLAGAGTGRLFS